jgi:pyruvate decarboxylase
MAKHITATTAVLRKVSTAAEDIDRALSVMLKESRPVYIGVPTDVAYALVSDEGLKTPLVRTLPPNDKGTEENVINAIRSLFEKASQPILVVDGGE